MKLRRTLLWTLLGVSLPAALSAGTVITVTSVAWFWQAW